MQVRPGGLGWLLVTSLVACTSATRGTKDRPSAPFPGPTTPRRDPDRALSELLLEDRQRTTSRGNTFVAPARFRLSQLEHAILLEAPESDLTIRLVEVDAPDGPSAITRAWSIVGEGGTVHRVQSSYGYRAKQGWERGYVVEYASPASARLKVVATSRGRGEHWTVVLVAGSTATYDKRRAAIHLVSESLRPKGYERETLAGRPVRVLDEERIARITEFVEEARRQANIPGMGFGLIQDDQVVFAGGFGVRELGKPEKVDETTLFGIASNTKALTTLLLAVLVDEGRLGWDRPVASVFPGFKLDDAEATRRILVKHLVCACTGLPRRDWKYFFEFGQTKAEDVFADLAATRPTTGFGEAFQYSNPLATAAGFIAGRVAFPGRELGAAYDAAMRGRVFDPLGMADTTFDVGRMLGKNHASPHAQDFQRDVAVGPRELLPMQWPWRPTGGAWSSVRDLLRYLRLELAGGVLQNGKRLVSEANLVERRKPQIAMGEGEHYGMGLRVRTDWGVPVVFHPGYRLGYASQAFFLPDHGVAGVVLANADSGTMVRDPIMRRVVEVLFDGAPEAAGDLDAAAAKYRAVVERERAGYVLPPDPVVVSKLAKRYTNADLGEIRVKPAATGVIFDFGEWSSSMATYEDGLGSVFLMTTDPGELGFAFEVSARDGLRTLVTREMQHEYEFVETR